MRLIVKGDIVPSERVYGIMQRAFEISQRELGLSNHGEDIEIRFVDSVIEGCGVAGVDSLDRNPFTMRFIKMLAADIVCSLPHEMVHVRDIVSGDLTRRQASLIYRGNEMKLDDLTCFYKTKNMRRIMESIPFEREAYTVGTPLSAAIFMQLPDLDIQFMADQANRVTGSLTYNNYVPSVARRQMSDVVLKTIRDVQ